MTVSWRRSAPWDCGRGRSMAGPGRPPAAVPPGAAGRRSPRASCADGRLEEEDGRIFRDYAEGLRETYPASAKVFEEMAEEESGHRRALIDLFRRKFGEHIPMVRREDVRGFVRRKPLWLTRPLGLEAVRAGGGAGGRGPELLPQGR